MAGFAFSFTVIGLFWIGHHELFRPIKALDRSLILLNLLFLGCIAFLPYPTSLLSAAADQALATSSTPSASPRRSGRGRDLAVRHPHRRAGPPWRPTRGVPLDPAADPPRPGGVPALDPGRHRPARPSPVPVALALFSVLVIRRLEPPEPEPTTAERDDRPG
jgi:Endosomal/lysosomal potassium channel TMEM175